MNRIHGANFLVLPESGPPWDRVYRALREEILGGVLPAGTRLPATRALARELGFSRNTVETAYDQLRAEGFIESRVGAGSYVAAGADAALLQGAAVASTAEPKRMRLSRYGVSAASFDPPSLHDRLRYDFRYGLPDAELAEASVWLRTLTTASRQTSLPAGADATFGYNATEGWLPLRQEIHAHLARSRGVVCDVDQILIVSGSQQGLDLSARLLLDRGDSVATEDPQYLGAREVFRSVGARLLPVPVDDEGMLTPTEPARLAYVTPSHQFPTGAVMSLRRRLALLAWAERNDAYVIEDDYDSEFRYDGAPLRAIHGLQGSDRVIYLGTFSKVLFPSLRLGYVVVPRLLLKAYRSAKWLSSTFRDARAAGACGLHGRRPFRTPGPNEQDPVRRQV